MATDIYTKAFSDPDKWLAACWLINVVDPAVIANAADYILTEPEKPSQPVAGEAPSPGGGIHDPSKGVAVPAVPAKEDIYCEIVRSAQHGLVEIWKRKRKSLACKQSKPKQVATTAPVPQGARVVRSLSLTQN